MSEIKQRTPEWHEQRAGRFTASNILPLMAVRGLGEGAKTLCLEKAIEKIFGPEEEEHYISKDMQRGIELEPMAFKWIKAKMALDFIEVTPASFVEYGEDAGASPDGYVGVENLEIKCPNRNTFFKLVASGEVDPKYYLQMQMQMLCTGASKTYFLNYYVHLGEEFTHLIIVDRNDAMISTLKDRIKEAVEIRNEYISDIKSNLQF